MTSVESPPDLPVDADVWHCSKCDIDVWIQDDETRLVVS